MPLIAVEICLLPDVISIIITDVVLKPKISLLRWLFVLLLFVGAVAYFAFVSQRDKDSETPQETVAATSPVTKAWDANLLLMTAEQLASLPSIDGFSHPCGSNQGAFCYDAQSFARLNKKRASRHIGQDWNGVGGQNTDAGMPIHAAARGLVIYSGNPSSGWGNTVILAHRLPDGRVVQSLYAHLQQRLARVGRMVGRGDVIGTLGNADGLYLAHLHFELIESRVAEANQRGYATKGLMNRLDPAKLMARYPAPNIPDSFNALRQIRMMEARKQPVNSKTMPAGYMPLSPSQFLTSLI